MTKYVLVFNFLLFSLATLAQPTDSLLSLKDGLTLKESGYLDEHLLFGNPDNARKNLDSANNFLMVKPQFVLSYNKSKSIPNWAAWHLSKKWMGAVERQNDFMPDSKMPKGWFRVNPTYYRNSGFDRGHLCPSADRTKTEYDNTATFQLTNIVPQAPNNNQHVWKYLEDYCRELVFTRKKHLYIMAGIFGQGGTGRNGYKEKIYQDKIEVPHSLWKIIVAIPENKNALENTDDIRVVAVLIPNDEEVESSWDNYCVSIDQLEELLCYDFLSNLPVEIQDALEKKVTSRLKFK
jgi:endonuclease G, mitochondrial